MGRDWNFLGHFLNLAWGISDSLKIKSRNFCTLLSGRRHSELVEQCRSTKRSLAAGLEAATNTYFSYFMAVLGTVAKRVGFSAKILLPSCFAPALPIFLLRTLILSNHFAILASMLFFVIQQRFSIKRV